MLSNVVKCCQKSYHKIGPRMTANLLHADALTLISERMKSLNNSYVLKWGTRNEEAHSHYCEDPHVMRYHKFLSHVEQSSGCQLLE